jgi:hypothetical protein
LRQFELLMYLALAIAVAVLPFPDLTIVAPVTFTTVAIAAAWWSFVVALIWLTTRRGKRWTLYLLFALFVVQTGQLSYAGWLSAVYIPRAWVFISITAIEALAYFLIFTGDNRQWSSQLAVRSNISQ